MNSIIATHSHIDHIGSLSRFRQEYGTKIIAYEPDAQAIETGARVGAETYEVGYQPCPVDIHLEKAERCLRFGKYVLKIIHIPGHTKDSIAIYTDVASKRILFGQDVNGSYEAIWGGKPNQAITSLQKLMELKADILCEGHFGIYPPDAEVNKYIDDCLHQLQQRTRGLHERFLQLYHSRLYPTLLSSNYSTYLVNGKV